MRSSNTLHRSRQSSRSYIQTKHLAYALLAAAIVACSAMLMLPSPFYLVPFGLIGIAIFILGTLFFYLIIFFMNPNEIFEFLQYVAFPYEKIIAALVMASLFIHIAMIKKEFKVYYIDVALTAFLMAAGISILGAEDLQASYDAWQQFFRIFLVYLLIARIVETPKQLKAVIFLFIISIGFLAISSTIQYYRGEFEVRQGIARLHSFGGGLIDPNTLATSLILGLSLMFYMAKAHRNLLLRLFMYGLMGSCIWAVILTGSRGGMVGGIAVLGLLVWHSRHKVVGAVVAVAVLVALGVSMPQQYSDRFMTIFHVGESDVDGAGASAYGRINGLILGFKFFTKNPITGVGIDNFGLWHHREPGGDWTDAHNLIGKLVGELGLLGVITFFFFVYRFSKTIAGVRQKYRDNDWDPDFLYHLSEAIKIGLIMLFVQGLFGHNLYRGNWYFFAAFVVTVAKLVEMRMERERTIEQADIPPLTAETERP